MHLCNTIPSAWLKIRAPSNFFLFIALSVDRGHYEVFLSYKYAAQKLKLLAPCRSTTVVKGFANWIKVLANCFLGCVRSTEYTNSKRGGCCRALQSTFVRSWCGTLYLAICICCWIFWCTHAEVCPQYIWSVLRMGDPSGSLLTSTLPCRTRIHYMESQ